jgi:sec-independent protein translocase protein TatA
MMRQTAVKVVELSPFHHTKGNTMLGRVGIPELIIILMIIILIFGANRLPEIGRGIGKGIRNFKDATKDGENNP